MELLNGLKGTITNSSCFCYLNWQAGGVGPTTYYFEILRLLKQGFTNYYSYFFIITKDILNYKDHTVGEGQA